MKKQLTFEEVLNLIKIGFCQPKFYTPSSWAKAKRIMDKLVSMNVGVIAYDYGRGKGKYTTTNGVTNETLANLILNK